MSKQFVPLIVTANLLAIVGIGLGCDGKPLSGPTHPTTSVAQPTISLVPSPSITSVSPNAGSTGGDTPLTVTGTGFLSGATVTVGGAIAPRLFAQTNRDATTIWVDTPRRATGIADVVVTNPGGSFARLTGGYTYASPQSFNFNGEWWGNDRIGEYLLFAFTIRNNALISVTCQTYPGSETATFVPSPSVANGEFSLSGGGRAISGKIVSATAAVGTLDIPFCGSATVWVAAKRPQ